MYSEELIQEALDDTRGKKVNGVTITDIRYADDTIIIAETEHDLQVMITRLNETCKIYGMELNAKKTKVMVIERFSGTKIQITSGKTVLEQVKSYCYLGSQITEDGRCTDEIRKRTAMAKIAFQRHKELFNSNINRKTKMNLLKTYVWSFFTYGCEAWTIGKDIMDKIRAYEMWYYRRFLKIRWTDGVTNEEVLRRMNVTPMLLTIIAKRKAALFGHVARGSSGAVFCNIVEGYIEGKRSSGRQRRTWMDGIKEWVNIKNCGILKGRCSDRVCWRTMVSNLRIT